MPEYGVCPDIGHMFFPRCHILQHYWLP
uniref:Uncharacterized protein n=1 Tax=Rhizophora mucronata TaxID=61149 RepID=A0A2P2P711_RHIMU